MKAAFIDLGTNGFRLYVVEKKTEGLPQLLLRHTIEVQLGSEGIARIGVAPFERGVAAMVAFSQLLATWPPMKVVALGTAALRLAQNAGDFCQAIYEKTGIKVQIISGAQEAHYIYEGMKHILPQLAQPVLMVDIGGGSVECIIGNSDKQLWARSFDTGVSILRERFQPFDRLRAVDIRQIQTFLDQEMADLKPALAQFQPLEMAIACGTLNIIMAIFEPDNTDAWHLPPQYYHYFEAKWGAASLSALRQEPLIPGEKAEMLSVSLVLMSWLQAQMPRDGFWVSRHSLKSGVLATIFEP